MPNNEQNDLEKKLEHAFENMLHRVKGLLDTAEEKSLPVLKQILETTKKQAIHLEEVTEEEAEKLTQYLKRELHGVASELKESGHELESLVKGDLELMGRRLLEVLLNIGDQARVELWEFTQELDHPIEHVTGEITIAGDLQCLKCKEILHLEETAHIPHCPECQHTKFLKTHIKEK